MKLRLAKPFESSIVHRERVTKKTEYGERERERLVVRQRESVIYKGGGFEGEKGRFEGGSGEVGGREREREPIAANLCRFNKFQRTP